MARLVLGIDARPAKQGAQEFRRSAESIQGSARNTVQRVNRIEGAFDKLRRSGLAVNGVLGAIAGAGGLGFLIKRSLDAAANIEDLANRAGVTTDALQELTFAARRYGVQQDALVDGIKELQIRADEFATTGKGEAAEAFERLGFTANEAARLIDGTGRGVEVVVERIRDLESTAARARAFEELFGGQAGEQIRQITGDIGALRREANELGLVLEEDVIRNADEARDKFDLLSNVLQKQVVSAIAQSAPQISGVLDGLLDDLPQAISQLESLAEKFGIIEDVSKNTRIFQLRGELEEIRRLEQQAQQMRDDSMLARGAGFISDQIAEITGLQADFEARRQALRFELAELTSGPLQSTSDSSGGGALRIDVPAPSGGGGGSSALPEPPGSFAANQRASDIIREQRAELDRLGESLRSDINPAWAQYQERVQNLNTALEAGRITQREFLTLSQQAGERFSDTTQTATEGLQNAQKAADQLGFSFSSAFEDAIVKGQEFSTVLQGLAQDILRILVRTQITQPAAGALSDVFGSAFGNIFSGGGGTTGAAVPTSAGGLGQPLPTFAEGGITRGPSIAGERGPEAVIPLPGNRKVPVQMQGGETNVYVENHSGQEANVQRSRNGNGGEDIRVVIGKEVGRQIAGGVHDKPMRARYGITPSTGTR
ncbi:hypothetical protein CKO28_09805 [Rhodovibrio sodomensis]|uniref:Bacteriophage tail tape measure C-terminal domain-containing protein n=1 Tax=Rhodovibrio sodomensis TaxID=1088 RepID=A0ABS1DFM4_9PROT|nr:hypothetical protein [Rhodovibrio sodomensis]MBK1668328.1 hypothetical protein [Rhodovibrio sodomensis]